MQSKCTLRIVHNVGINTIHTKCTQRKYVQMHTPKIKCLNRHTTDTFKVQCQNRICYQICNNAANHTINLGPQIPQNAAYLSLEIGAYIDYAPPNDCRAITKSCTTLYYYTSTHYLCTYIKIRTWDYSISLLTSLIYHGMQYHYTNYGLPSIYSLSSFL